MANRFGNQYRIAIGTETAYASGGTVAGTPATTTWETLTVHSGVMVQTPVVNTATTTHKSLTHIDTPCEIIPTTKMGNVTVSGDATFEILKKYLSGVTKDVGIIPDTQHRFFSDPDDAPSFILLQLWSDTPSESNFTVDRAIGAKLLSLEITGTSGGLIQFNANFETQPIEREVTQTITGTDPGNVCGTPLQFGDVIANLALRNDATALETFTINLINEYTADATKFANSRVISNPRIIRQGGELSYTCNYDSAGDENDVDIINDPDSVLYDQIWLTDGALGGEYIEINIASIATGIERPDTDKDYFKLNYSGRIVYDSNAECAVTIDLSHLT